MIMKLWICRDKYGLWLSKTRPFLSDGMWTNNNGTLDRIDSDDLFSEVTFENSPQEVELKLVDYGISN